MLQFLRSSMNLPKFSSAGSMENLALHILESRVRDHITPVLSISNTTRWIEIAENAFDGKLLIKRKGTWLQLLCYCHLQVFFSSLITKGNIGKHAALTLFSNKSCCFHLTHWRCNIINSPAIGYNWTSTVKFSKLLLNQMWKIFEKLSGKKGKNKTSLLLKKKKKKKSLSF